MTGEIHATIMIISENLRAAPHMHVIRQEIGRYVGWYARFG